ncbi:MAG: hypothetical protein HLUCCA08_06135 [Rhodobacteraceae bacterium HLUCCA08]|nr:MAG: hypothetical protein HLUCCA08_06135 [Rhodobacteraceae bacterium HLUCCA08]
MPMPWTYRHSEREFKAFLADVKDRTGLSSDNMAYTAVDGVLQVFRKRLTPAEGIAFADILPSTLRAIFVAGWDITAAPAPWADRATLTAEAKALRRNHNLTPDDILAATAWALRRSLRQADLDRVLARIGPEAQDFWRLDGVDPADLEQRIV